VNWVLQILQFRALDIKGDIMGKYCDEQPCMTNSSSSTHQAVPYFLSINIGLFKDLQSILPNCITMFQCTIFAVCL